MPRLLTLVLISGIAFPVLVSGQTERAHEAHVHGLTRIQMAYEAGRLNLELYAPGMDLVGFEHPPRDRQEREALDAALAKLEAAVDWLGFDPSNSCTLVTIDAHAHGYKNGHQAAASANADELNIGHKRGHGDHHDAKEADHDHAHAEFHVEVTATCDAKPVAVLIRLAQRFPRIETVRVDSVTETAQNRVELARNDERVPLQ